MRLLLISGSGNGAGKSTLARTLSREVWSLAGGIRDELGELYPGYNWRNTTQAYKDSTVVDGYGSGKLTVRQVMIDYGQGRCTDRPTYWVDKLADRLKLGQYAFSMTGTYAVAVDDCRKLVEIERLRTEFPQSTHIHLVWSGAVHEPQYENDQLEAVADYVVLRR